jgi:hypothetical protein
MLSAKIGYFRPTGFDPRSISGLALWLDSADASTLFQNSNGTTPATATGDPIGYWRDKSGSGSHVTQATAANRPSRAVGPFGKPAIDFDGVNDCLFCDNTAVTAAATGDKALTIFAIGQMHNSAEVSVNGLGTWCAFGSSASGTPFIYMRSDAGSGVFQVNVRNDASSSVGTSVPAGGPAGDGAAVASSAIDSFIASATVRTAISGLLTTGRIHTAMSAEGNGIGRNPPLLGSTAISPAARQGTSTLNRFTVGALGRNVFGDFFPARISEVLVYSRALSDAERVSVVQWLGSKYETVVYNAPVVSNADAQSWINRVYANGGTVSTSTASAVNDFCNSIDSAGIRDRFYRLNLFAGTGLASALVPLYRGQSLGGTQFGNATDTNNNFVSADYVETAGLQGNGSNKSLDTGLPTNFASDRHIGFVPSVFSTTASRYYLGARNSAFSSLFSSFSANTTSLIGFYNYSDNSFAGGAPNSTATARRLYIATSNPSLTPGGFAYSNAVSAGAGLAAYSNPAATTTLAVFAMKQADNSFNSPTNATLSGYTIGLSMTASQVTTYNAIWTTLLTAMGRA